MILVTGAAGAIGQRLVRKLVAVNGDNTVITITREPLDIPGALNRVHDLSEPLTESILDIGYQVKGIIHLAAIHNVGDSLRRPEYYYQQNTQITNNILGYAISRQVDWFMFASTGMVYAQSMDPSAAKESDRLGPGNPYAVSKLLCENIVSTVCQHHRIRAGIFRIFNVVTPVDSSDTVRSRFLIPSVCRAAKLQQPFDVYVNNQGHSETIVRDYIHVDDVVSTLYQGSAYFDSKGPTIKDPRAWDFPDNDVEIFNVCTGMGTSVLQIIDHAQKVTGQKIPITISKPDHWEPYLVGNPERSRMMLNATRAYSVHDMIEQQWRLINE